MTWKPDEFLVARMSGPSKMAGYTYRGLGLHITEKVSRGRRQPMWILTHLGSGHAICRITGTVTEAFPIATEIAECGDWSFEGLHGWKNLDPELKEKTSNILSKYKNISRGRSGSCEPVARQIAEARA